MWVWFSCLRTWTRHWWIWVYSQIQALGSMTLTVSWMSSMATWSRGILGLGSPSQSLPSSLRPCRGNLQAYHSLYFLGQNAWDRLILWVTQELPSMMSSFLQGDPEQCPPWSSIPVCPS